MTCARPKFRPETIAGIQFFQGSQDSRDVLDRSRIYDIHVKRAYRRTLQYCCYASDNKKFDLISGQRFENRRYPILLHSCSVLHEQNLRRSATPPGVPPASRTTSSGSARCLLRRRRWASFVCANRKNTRIWSAG